MLPFSPRLRIAFSHAEALAASRKPYVVSSLDLLFGILHLGNGVGPHALKAAGFADGAPIPEPRGQHLTNDASVQYAASALTALSAAASEAVAREHQIVGVEHMLVGILRPPAQEVRALFAKKGVRVRTFLSDVRRQM